MRPVTIIGISVLAIVWVWLAWVLLAYGGVNLKNIIVLAITAIVIFKPLYSKYIAPARENKRNGDKQESETK